MPGQVVGSPKEDSGYLVLWYFISKLQQEWKKQTNKYIYINLYQWHCRETRPETERGGVGGQSALLTPPKTELWGSRSPGLRGLGAKTPGSGGPFGFGSVAIVGGPREPGIPPPSLIALG